MANGKNMIDIKKEIYSAIKDLAKYIGTKSTESIIENPIPNNIDTTIELYKRAHITKMYNEYDTQSNFVDIVRDKMSKLNEAIYKNILITDPRYKQDCYCQNKAANAGDTYEVSDGVSKQYANLE